ncbi:MAG: hypothetical protein ACRBBM_18215 [Pseudomonadaceae bacterium]
MSFKTIPEQLASLQGAFDELSNGVWRKNDIWAVALILGVLSSVAMSAYAVVSVQPSDDPDPIESSAGTDTDAATGTDTE